MKKQGQTAMQLLIRENHRTEEQFTLEGTSGGLPFSLLLKAELYMRSDQVAWGFRQSRLEILQGGKTPLGPHSTTPCPCGEIAFPYLHAKPLWFQLTPLPLVLLLGTSVKSLASAPRSPSCRCQGAFRCPKAVSVLG